MQHVFFHSRDLDGHCSGAIVRRWLLKAATRPGEIRMHPIDYGDEFPFADLRRGDKVWMVDWCLQPVEGFDQLVAQGVDVVLIDHHKTSLPLAGRFRGVISADRAACELAHTHLFGHCPRVVELLGKYDSWRKDDEWETEVLPFQYGMRMQSTDPSTDEGMGTWNLLLRWPLDVSVALESVNQIQADGRMLMRYEAKKNAELMAKRAFPMQFEGLRAIACIGSGYGSQAFASVWDPAKYDLMVSISNVKGQRWDVSLYTEKDLDLSPLAKKRGGGGHAKACGFQTTDLSSVLAG